MTSGVEIQAFPPVIVVRDDGRSGLRTPPPHAFTPSTDVTYVDMSEVRAVVAGAHYVFNCARANERVHALCDGIERAGAQATFVVRHIDCELARRVERTGASVLPSFGLGAQISDPTMLRAMRRVLSGRRVIASGFVTNSLGAGRAPDAASHTFARCLIDASRAANEGARTVAAVLSLHRTGSNFLRDVIGLTVSGRVDVFHEHCIPAASEVARDGAAPEKQSWRAHLRKTILDAERRVIFVAERRPDERLTSYFLRRHRSWLTSLLDPARGVFRDTAAVERRFRQWLHSWVGAQRAWYRTWLTEPFGVNVLSAERTGDGLWMDQRGATTLLVLPTDGLDRLRDDIAARFGGRDAYDSIASNSLGASRPGREIECAFRRQFRFPVEIADALWQIPEVARLHPRPAPIGRPCADGNAVDEESMGGCAR